jgi:hypothetical protein
MAGHQVQVSNAITPTVAIVLAIVYYYILRLSGHLGDCTQMEYKIDFFQSDRWILN